MRIPLVAEVPEQPENVQAEMEQQTEELTANDASSSEAPETTDESAPAIPESSGADDSAASATAATAAGAATAAAAAATATNSFKSLDKKVQYGVLGAVAAIAVIIIALVALPGLSGISVEEAKQAFMETELYEKGAVSSKYTNETAYEITDFRIDSQESGTSSMSANELGWAKTWQGADDVKAVTCSGTIANESFETDFRMIVYSGKINGTWVSLGSHKTLAETTTPLKGPDEMYDQYSMRDMATYTDFSSTLDKSNGAYTSTATATISIPFWFGTDTATETQTFTFDPDNGWTTDPQEVQFSNTSTSWTITGKTWTGTGYGTGKNTANITLNKIIGESVTASYSISDGNSKGGSGTIEGTMEHEFGSTDFAFTLKNSASTLGIKGTGRDAYSGEDQIHLSATSTPEDVDDLWGWTNDVFSGYLEPAGAANA